MSVNNFIGGANVLCTLNQTTASECINATKAIGNIVVKSLEVFPLLGSGSPDFACQIILRSCLQKLTNLNDLLIKTNLESRMDCQ